MVCDVLFIRIILLNGMSRLKSLVSVVFLFHSLDIQTKLYFSNSNLNKIKKNYNKTTMTTDNMDMTTLVIRHLVII